MAPPRERRPRSDAAEPSGASVGERIAALQAIARTFGPPAAARKLVLLRALGVADSLPAHGRRRRVLDATLAFLRAYPDDPAVLRAVEALVARLAPLNPRTYSFQYGVARCLPRVFTGIDVDWSDVEDDSELADALVHVQLPGEVQGTEDIGITFAEWFRAMRPPRPASDLEVLLDLFERSSLGLRLRAHLYDHSHVPLAFTPASAAALRLEGGPTRYQRKPLDRGSRSVAAVAAAVRRPLKTVALGARGGREVVDLALRSLSSRGLQIYPLTYADPRDVLIAECGRGVRLVLVGVLPEMRTPLETLCFALALKNGVPIAYGPVAAFLGASEIGINLFPEFRGAEIRHLYVGFMRALHHVFGVEHFHLTSYGVGENNPEAIASGAFWFYRHLGFRPAEPAVEALARAEERRMAAEPGHRSDRRMLRRMSKTSIHLDLSGGCRSPFPFGPHGIAQSRWIAREPGRFGGFGGDRARAEDQAARKVARLTGLPASTPALRAMAPALCMIPELPRWPRRDLVLLRRILAAKGARSEAAAARLLNRHERLEQGLRASCAAPR